MQLNGICNWCELLAQLHMSMNGNQQFFLLLDITQLLLEIQN
jgi:hypothetical protein